jgi:hypothetical protein
MRVRQLDRPVEREHVATLDQARRRERALAREQIESAELVVGPEDAPGRPGRRIGSREQLAIAGERFHRPLPISSSMRASSAA